MVNLCSGPGQAESISFSRFGTATIEMNQSWLCEARQAGRKIDIRKLPPEIA